MRFPTFILVQSQLVEKIGAGKLESGIALVRPPRHHVESDGAIGFCLFNNVAIAANYFLLNERVCFDFSYPTGDDGSYTTIGEGLGAGYNINVW
ncbi:hypothetical protein Taro_031520 [Colocasia esculenta]|uniref:Histone deacetylase domain-containing protein n=1 Tax=Colocasia esculenta TaxID=4460 RepID=A0A843VS67_COLES|nr:hypothetical protein [Colocasia esculenta]